MIKYIKLIIIFVIFLIPSKSYSLIEVDITRGNLNPLPVAVSPIFSDKNSKEELKKELKIDDVGAEISKIVENNLKATGLFNPLEKKAFLQKTLTYYMFET